MSPYPLEARTLRARGNGYVDPKISLFVVDGAGISDLSIYGTLILIPSTHHELASVTAPLVRQKYLNSGYFYLLNNHIFTHRRNHTNSDQKVATFLAVNLIDLCFQMC